MGDSHSRSSCASVSLRTPSRMISIPAPQDKAAPPPFLLPTPSTFKTSLSFFSIFFQAFPLIPAIAQPGSILKPYCGSQSLIFLKLRDFPASSSHFTFSCPFSNICPIPSFLFTTLIPFTIFPIFLLIHFSFYPLPFNSLLLFFLPAPF